MGDRFFQGGEFFVPAPGVCRAAALALWLAAAAASDVNQAAFVIGK